MTVMSRFDPLKRLRAVTPGSVKAYKGSGWQLVAASYEESPGKIAEDGLPEPDHWYVSYVSVYEDPSEDDGYGLTVKMTYEHFDPFDAGMKFQELCGLLPESHDQDPASGLASYYPSHDPLEERAWAKSMFDGAYELARKAVMRELQKEAADLKEARTPYPPEESVLGQLLSEIGALPDPPSTT